MSRLQLITSLVGEPKIAEEIILLSDLSHLRSSIINLHERKNKLLKQLITYIEKYESMNIGKSHLLINEFFHKCDIFERKIWYISAKIISKKLSISEKVVYKNYEIKRINKILKENGNGELEKKYKLHLPFTDDKPEKTKNKIFFNYDQIYSDEKNRYSFKNSCIKSLFGINMPRLKKMFPEKKDSDDKKEKLINNILKKRISILIKKFYKLKDECCKINSVKTYSSSYANEIAHKYNSVSKIAVPLYFKLYKMYNKANMTNTYAYRNLFGDVGINYSKIKKYLNLPDLVEERGETKYTFTYSVFSDYFDKYVSKETKNRINFFKNYNKNKK